MNNSFMAVNIMVYLGNKRIKKNLEKDDTYLWQSDASNEQFRNFEKLKKKNYSNYKTRNDKMETYRDT